MALQFFDGLDDYGISNLGSFQTAYVLYGTPQAITTGAFGGTALGIAGSAAEWDFIMPTGVTTLFFGTRIIYTQTSAGAQLLGLSFSDTSNNVLAMVGLSAGSGVSTLSACTGGSHNPGRIFSLPGTVVGSQTVLTLPNVWYELEAMLTVGSGTSGAIVVKLNGVIVLNITGINTQGSNGSHIGFAGNWGSDQVRPYFDDLYGADETGVAPYNTFLSTVAGPMGPRVYTLFPNANSSPLQWTPSTGSNFSNVNSSTFQTSQYNSATASGQQDLYTIPTPLAELGTAVGTILAVQTTFVGNENDAGTVQVAGSIKSGGTIYQGATRTMVASFFKYFDLYVTDPATSASWSASKFNSTGNVFVGVDRIT